MNKKKFCDFRVLKQILILNQNSLLILNKNNLPGVNTAEFKSFIKNYSLESYDLREKVMCKQYPRGLFIVIL